MNFIADLYQQTSVTSAVTGAHVVRVNLEERPETLASQFAHIVGEVYVFYHPAAHHALAIRSGGGVMSRGGGGVMSRGGGGVMSRGGGVMSRGGGGVMSRGGV